jgi:uncharacterized membrane protein YccF (DUF307 family)
MKILNIVKITLGGILKSIGWVFKNWKKLI